MCYVETLALLDISTQEAQSLLQILECTLRPGMNGIERSSNSAGTGYSAEAGLAVRFGMNDCFE